MTRAQLIYVAAVTGVAFLIGCGAYHNPPAPQHTTTYTRTPLETP